MIRMSIKVLDASKFARNGWQQWLAYLLSGLAALGLIPSNSKNNSLENFSQLLSLINCTGKRKVDSDFKQGFQPPIGMPKLQQNVFVVSGPVIITVAPAERACQLHSAIMTRHGLLHKG